MSKIPSLIGPELQCLKSPTYSISGSWAHTTFSRRFRTLLSQGDFGGTLGPHYFFRRFFGSIIIAGLLFSFQRAPYFGLSSHCFQYRFRKSVIYTYRQYKSFIKSPDNLMLSFCSITSMHVHGHGKQLF